MMRLTLVRYTLIGAVIGACCALFGLMAPEVVAPHADWKHQGIRLFRDEGELWFYFHKRTDWIVKGAPPYTKGHFQEYPPLAVLYYSWPRLLTDDLAVYVRIFVAQSVVWYGLLFGLTAAILERSGLSKKRLLLLCLPAALYFSLWRFDVLPAVLMSASLLALLYKRSSAAFAFLAAAILAKLYPALFVVPFCVWLGSPAADAAMRKSAVRGLRNALIAGLAIVAPLAVFGGFRGLLTSVAAHISRPFDAGSIGFLLSRHLLPAVPAGGLIWTAVRDLLPVILIVLQYGAVIPLIIWSRIDSLPRLVRSCVFLLIPFLVFNRFFSQHFILWLTPLFLPVARRSELALLAVLDILIFIEFPVMFGIGPTTPAFETVAVIRTVFFLMLWAVVGRELFRRVEPERA